MAIVNHFSGFGGNPGFNGWPNLGGYNDHNTNYFNSRYLYSGVFWSMGFFGQ